MAQRLRDVDRFFGLERLVWGFRLFGVWVFVVFFGDGGGGEWPCGPARFLSSVWGVEIRT